MGPSTDQGESAVDAMDREVAAHGQSARNALQMELLEGRELADARAALAFVRRLPDVDARRVAIVGHSFGGSLSVLMTEREPTLRAAVVFSAAGYSWDRSPELRARLLDAARRTVVRFSSSTPRTIIRPIRASRSTLSSESLASGTGSRSIRQSVGLLTKGTTFRSTASQRGSPTCSHFSIFTCGSETSPPSSSIASART